MREERPQSIGILGIGWHYESDIADDDQKGCVKEAVSCDV
jgi:hypothetical protein